MDFFTADLHLGHNNILKYQSNRGKLFQDVKSMDDEIITRWNETVRVTDTVYVLGDFTLSSKRAAEAYIARLNGKIKIVPGGHDLWLKRFKSTSKVQVLPPLVSLEYPQGDDEYPLVIVLCHYPMKSWDRSHYGSWHLFGHVHGNMKGEYNSLDVGVDVQNMYPVSLDELKTYFALYNK